MRKYTHVHQQELLWLMKLSKLTFIPLTMNKHLFYFFELIDTLFSIGSNAWVKYNKYTKFSSKLPSFSFIQVHKIMLLRHYYIE